VNDLNDATNSRSKSARENHRRACWDFGGVPRWRTIRWHTSADHTDSEPLVQRLEEPLHFDPEDPEVSV